LYKNRKYSLFAESIFTRSLQKCAVTGKELLSNKCGEKFIDCVFGSIRQEYIWNLTGLNGLRLITEWGFPSKNPIFTQNLR
jgi:hypothetical protein